MKNKCSAISLMLKKRIIDVKDFPKKGVLFKDITPVLEDPKIFKIITNKLYDLSKQTKFDTIVSPEARGFWFGLPLAMKAGASFIPARKPYKLPRKTISQSYELEYGGNKLEIHKDSIKPNSRVLIVDDLLATGGTIKAIYKMVKKCKAKVVGCAFLIALKSLPGIKLIENELGVPCIRLVEF